MAMGEHRAEILVNHHSRLIDAREMELKRPQKLLFVVTLLIEDTMLI
jgi:hypothetical protein